MPSINLESNPFACDCFSLDLAKFMHEELDAVVQTWFRAKIDDVVCRSPAELAGKALFELEYERLRCPYPSTYSNNPRYLPCQDYEHEPMNLSVNYVRWSSDQQGIFGRPI